MSNVYEGAIGDPYNVHGRGVTITEIVDTYIFLGEAKSKISNLSQLYVEDSNNIWFGDVYKPQGCGGVVTDGSVDWTGLSLKLEEYVDGGADWAGQEQVGIKLKYWIPSDRIILVVRCE